jgi:hypothetical protein
VEGTIIGSWMVCRSARICRTFDFYPSHQYFNHRNLGGGFACCSRHRSHDHRTLEKGKRQMGSFSFDAWMFILYAIGLRALNAVYPIPMGWLLVFLVMYGSAWLLPYVRPKLSSILLR